MVSGKKKLIKALIILLLVLLVASPILVNSKPFVTCLVRLDAEKLTELANMIINAGEVPQDASCFCYAISYRDSLRTVEFNTLAYGLVPSSVYQGFYYSASNEPLGYHYDGSMEFLPDGIGWKWVEENGDNWMYTEKITDNWYWFEMHY